MESKRKLLLGYSAGWMASPGISRDCQIFGVPRYSATEGSWVDAGISRDGQSYMYFGVPGYSATEGSWVDGKSWDIPGLSELLGCTRILCHRGWLGGWQVLGYPRGVVVKEGYV